MVDLRQHLVLPHISLKQLGDVFEMILCHLKTSIKCCFLGCLGPTWSCPKKVCIEQNFSPFSEI
jgi:hypothetical protein